MMNPKPRSLTPHGPGFSFLDSVEVAASGQQAKATLWLDPALRFFEDHFPQDPMMPGVLIIEMAAQAAGVLWAHAGAGSKLARCGLAQVQGFRFLKPVRPNETLVAEVSVLKDFGKLAQFAAELSVDGTAVAAGQVTLARFE